MDTRKLKSLWWSPKHFPQWWVQLTPDHFSLKTTLLKPPFLTYCTCMDYSPSTTLCQGQRCWSLPFIVPYAGAHHNQSLSARLVWFHSGVKSGFHRITVANQSSVTAVWFSVPGAQRGDREKETECMAEWAQRDSAAGVHGVFISREGKNQNI